MIEQRLLRSESCPVCHRIRGQQTSSTLLLPPPPSSPLPPPPPPPPPSQSILTTTLIHRSSGLWMRLVCLSRVIFCFVPWCVCVRISGCPRLPPGLLPRGRDQNSAAAADRSVPVYSSTLSTPPTPPPPTPAAGSCRLTREKTQPCASISLPPCLE